MERSSLRKLISAGPVRAAQACVLSAGLLLALAMTGCAGSAAATIGGAALPEDKVTSEIQTQREAAGLADDKEFANFLGYSGMTGETLREQIIMGLARYELLDQQVRQAGFILTDHDVTEAVNEEKLKYETVEEWEQFLAQNGISEEDFVRSTRYQLGCDIAVKGGLVQVREVTDEEVQQTAAYYSMFYGGAEALPDDFEDQVRESLENSARSEAVNAWLDELAATQVQINDMPQGLPYDLEPSAAEGLGGGDDDGEEIVLEGDDIELEEGEDA